MIFLAAIAAGLAAGWLGRGRLGNLAHADLRAVDLILGAFAAQALLSLAGRLGWAAAGALPAAIYTLSFCALLYAIWCNRRLTGAGLLFVGTVANLVAVISGGGRMPVAPDRLADLGGLATLAQLGTGQSPIHTLARPGTLWYWLGDWIPVPSITGRATLVSIGDLFLLLGLIVVVERLMRATGGERRTTGGEGRGRGGGGPGGG